MDISFQPSIEGAAAIYGSISWILLIEITLFTGFLVTCIVDLLSVHPKGLLKRSHPSPHLLYDTGELLLVFVLKVLPESIARPALALIRCETLTLCQLQDEICAYDRAKLPVIANESHDDELFLL